MMDLNLVGAFFRQILGGIVIALITVCGSKEEGNWLSMEVKESGRELLSRWWPRVELITTVTKIELVVLIIFRFTFDFKFWQSVLAMQILLGLLVKELHTLLIQHVLTTLLYLKELRGRVQEGKCNLVSCCKSDLNLKYKLTWGSALLFVTTAKSPSLIWITKCAISIVCDRQNNFDAEARYNVRDIVLWKKLSRTTIWSKEVALLVVDAVSPSIAVYWIRAFRLEGIPRGIQILLSEKDTPSVKPFPGGPKSKGNVKLSSEQTILPRSRLSVAPIASKDCKSKTLRKATSLPSPNDKISGSYLLTSNGVWYLMTAVL